MVKGDRFKRDLLRVVCISNNLPEKSTEADIISDRGHLDRYG